jgi:hypothetical protein
VKVKVSLINLAENVKEFTKTIKGESKFSSEEATTALLNSALENCVKDFCTQFAVEYAPPAIVQQTKGSGQVAMQNVGKDYGLMKNMKVEFFMLKEKHGKRHAIPFAYGKIIEVGEDSAWAKIDDFEDAGVKENHFARIRSHLKSWKNARLSLRSSQAAVLKEDFKINLCAPPFIGGAHYQLQKHRSSR